MVRTIVIIAVGFVIGQFAGQLLFHNSLLFFWTGM